MDFALLRDEAIAVVCDGTNCISRALRNARELMDDGVGNGTSAALPGKALQFRQHLVASSGPTLELRYSVDLENRYFRARGR